MRPISIITGECQRKGWIVEDNYLKWTFHKISLLLKQAWEERRDWNVVRRNILDIYFWLATSRNVPTVKNKDGVYIASFKRGGGKLLEELLEYGIDPVPTEKGGAICEIGYSDETRQWYGWTRGSEVKGFDSKEEAIAYVDKDGMMHESMKLLIDN
jgi:hypothetical protein